MPAKRKQSRPSPQPTLHPPEQVVEALLAHLPFPERVRAAGVCRAWRQHLTQPGLQLWQALDIGHEVIWETGIDEHDDVSQEDRDDEAEERLRLFLPLQRWLWAHGAGLLQVQCSTAFNGLAMAEDGLLAAFLYALAATAPSLQALRLDGYAGMGLTNRSLVGIASMGGRLRQLALLGLQHVSDGSLMAALAQLPLLQISAVAQDLAIRFVNEEVRHATAELLQDEVPVYARPDIMRLLTRMALTLPALQTLALGYGPRYGLMAGAPGVLITRNARPLPAVMSRLMALSSLMLHDIGWVHAPNGLPHLPQAQHHRSLIISLLSKCGCAAALHRSSTLPLSLAACLPPQLRRLTLQGDCRRSSMLQPDLPHQLSTLASLEALQVALPRYIGRLPASLTQLVVSAYDKALLDNEMDNEMVAVCARDRTNFFELHLPALGSLRHLAFHHRQGVGQGPLLHAVCNAAKAMPQLVSLHLVNCNMPDVPPELCALSRLQLLNLSNNKALQLDGCRCLAQAPLHQLASCRWLDLRYERRLFARRVPLQLDTIAAIAAMPALERLALPPTVPYELFPHEVLQPRILHVQEVALLAQHRGPGLPPIRVVADLPQSDQWAAVYVDLPFGEVNEVLGVQLDRNIMHGVPT